MFNLYTGIPGSGKTLLAIMWDLWPLLEKGQQVYSNTWINWKGDNLKYFVDPIDIIHVKNAVIFFDEMGSILDSRNWKETPREVRYFFQQHRKRGIDIIATTQNISFIELSARAILGYMAKVSNLTPTEGLKGRKGIGTKLPFLFIKESPIDIETITDDKPSLVHNNFISSLMDIKVFWKASMFDKRYQKNKLELDKPLYDTNREIELTNKKHFYKSFYMCETCGKEHPYKGMATDRERELIQELQAISKLNQPKTS